MAEGMEFGYISRNSYTCCGKVALDLVGHNLLDLLSDAMCDHSMSCSYQRARFSNLPQPLVVAKPCRSVEYTDSHVCRLYRDSTSSGHPIFISTLLNGDNCFANRTFLLGRMAFKKSDCRTAQRNSAERVSDIPHSRCRSSHHIHD
jgi:hypothetical protein